MSNKQSPTGRYLKNSVVDHPAFNMLAGGIAGALSKSAVAPLERTKILCQTGESYGFIRSFMIVYKKEGIKGYWRGNMADILRIVPNRGVMFMTNDAVKDFLRGPNERHLTGWRSVVAGSAAGATATLATYPLDLARGRMAGRIGDSRYRTPFSTISITVKEEGFWALYRGLGPTLAGCLPYEGLKFGIYESMVAMVPKDPITHKPTVWWTLFCGAVAGVLGGTLTYPNDTVRRRMQMQGNGAARKYKHALDCYATMFRTEGIKSLFAGCTANAWRVGPSAAIQFGAFETIKALFSFMGQYS